MRYLHSAEPEGFAKLTVGIDPKFTRDFFHCIWVLFTVSDFARKSRAVRAMSSNPDLLSLLRCVKVSH